MTGLDRTGRDATGPDMPRLDRTGRDETGPDRTRQDKTRDFLTWEHANKHGATFAARKGR